MKVVRKVSIYGLTMYVHLAPYPYMACYYGIKEHPYYYDCFIYATCEYGELYVKNLWYKAFDDESAKKAIEEMGLTIDEILPKKFYD